MIYNDFQGLKLSALGMGNMRLPVLNDDNAQIDEAATAEMLDYCMAHGVNYYDTAWGYHHGKSETVVGKVMSRYPRESYYLASKFPGFSKENFENVAGIFERQLEKCQTEYFDFYLFHSVTENNIDGYLSPEYGVMDYLLEQKKNGRIRHLGFSTHAYQEAFERFVNAYGEHLEFCQLQLNYFDWTYQKAKEKVDFLTERGIPVWVMEPIRGGSLASLSEVDMKKLQTARPDETAVGWALRFVRSLPQVKVILSGMSNLEQVKQNIAIFEQDKPLNASEQELILSVAQDIIHRTNVPCTACRYCEAGCPMGLAIPDLLRRYNEALMFSKDGSIESGALFGVEEGKRPADCIGCHACEAVCPQHIAIPDKLADFAARIK